MSSDFRKRGSSTHKIMGTPTNSPKMLDHGSAIIDVFCWRASIIGENLNQTYSMVDLVEPERVPGGPINVRSIGWRFCGSRVANIELVQFRS